MIGCTIVDCDQRSDEWRAVRVGKITATDAKALLSKGRGGEDALGKAQLRDRLAIEWLRGIAVTERAPFESEDMRLGRALEPAAILAYEVATGEIVTPVGFVYRKDLPIGCSPDGLVGDEGGVEVKCPKPSTYLKTVRARTVPSEYLPQIIHSLYVTGLAWWDFCSYCPDWEPDVPPLFRVRVWRASVDLDAYALAVQLFLGEVERELQQIRELRYDPSLSLPELTAVPAAGAAGPAPARRAPRETTRRVAHA